MQPSGRLRFVTLFLFRAHPPRTGEFFPFSGALFHTPELFPKNVYYLGDCHTECGDVL